MSTLSLRKIKHDSSSVDNITLDSSGRVGVQQSSPNTAFEVSGGWRLGTTSGTYSGGLGGGFNPNNNIYSMYCRDRTDTSWNDLWIEAKTLSFKTDGSNTAIYANQSGIVTLPYQPAFHAYPGSTVSVASGNNKFTFNSTKFNIGNHYSTSTGRFTAPVTGVYLFTFQAYYYPGTTSDAYQGIQLYVNGSGVYAGYCRGGYGDTTWGNSIHLRMNANDYLEFYTYPQSANNINTVGSYLTGHLVG